jgi:hypothetical protein
VRLKIEGTQRAVGFVYEKITVDGRKKQMFLVSKVVDKKEEERKGYNYK